jgi:predicted AAA+ superfamily ATPase
MKEPDYRPRALAPVVEQALETHPVVVVSGARQTGKTTLVRNLPSAAKRSFQSLDDFDVLELARDRPEDLLARGRRLTLDEVQRVPDLLLAIKRDVDARRQRGRFLLTGSANLLLMRQVADSLAGRAVYLLLAPFAAGEKRGEGSVPPWSEIASCRRGEEVVERINELPSIDCDWQREILRGGMPPAALARSARERGQWFEGYVRTYLERDLRDLSQIASLPDFRRLMGLAVHRLGQLVNQSELGRDAGISQATTHRYLGLLETTFQVHKVTPYSVNPSKRLIKSPKLYWADSGLAAHLAGVSGVSALRSSPLFGALAENAVFSGLLAWREAARARPEIHYWRTAGGAEVDFVVERGARLIPVEIKTARRIRIGDLRHLEIFLDDYARQAPWGAVLYDTDQAHPITRRVIGLPLSRFL